MTGAQWQALARHGGEHLLLVFVSAALASCISLPLGVVIADASRRTTLLALLGIIYTVPSLALFAVIVPLLGLGVPTAIAVLTLYATVFLTRSVALALSGIPSQIRENARALGTTRLQRLLRIELPMASPTLIAGLRTTLIMLIATASIAAWIDAGGLGGLLFEGLRQDDMRRVVTGSIAVAVLAVGVDGLLLSIERRARRRLHADQ